MGAARQFLDGKKYPFSNNLRPSINQWEITFMKSHLRSRTLPEDMPLYNEALIQA
jgi:hypothetical protein